MKSHPFSVAAATIFALLLACIGQGAMAVEQTGSMATARMNHTATRLSDGRVLVVGGYPSTASVEIYDPATGSFTPAAPLAVARERHVAALLTDGRVLVAGGVGTDGWNVYSLSSAEIYDPATGTWAAGPSLNWPREGGRAIVLLDGRVLVLNGNSNASGGGSGTPVCEIFDPATGTFSLTGSLSGRRDAAAVAMLADGRVLVAGGGTASAVASTQAEIWDPASGAWSATGSMASPRTSATATLLGNGKVLVAGGLSSNSSSSAVAIAELYDPATGAFTATGALGSLRWLHVAERLSDGSAMVSGGIAATGYLNGDIERYDADTGLWSSGGAMLSASRYHTATLLQNGNVLIAGGSGNSGSLATAALFDPLRDPLCATTPASITPASQSIGGFGGIGSVAVTYRAGCPWRVANVPSWIAITSGAQGWGDGTVSYSVPRNLDSARDGRFVIAENNFVVSQAANPCWAAPAISPASQSYGEAGGLGNISVTRPAECGTWTASTLYGWITLVGATSGSGDGAVSYSVAANSGGARSGTVRVGTATHTVSQAASACFVAPGIAPSSLSFAEAGGSGSVSITHPDGCGWAVGSVPAWITITSGASGAGSGTVALSVAPNTGNARSATISVGMGSFTVSQAASACVTATASLSPTSASFGAGGGSGTIAVTYPAGCPWTVTAASWITVTSGASGVGSGAVSYTVAANTGSARTHTALVANAGFTVSQAAAAPAPTYCASKGTTSSYEWIQQVTIAGQVRSTGNNGGYANLTTSTPAIALARGANSITLSKGGAYTEYWRIWIDFNNDFVFSDSELVYSGSSSGLLSSSITVPVTAPAGSTRMRISMKWGSAPLACETFSYGEVEDYTVSIP